MRVCKIELAAGLLLAVAGLLACFPAQAQEQDDSQIELAITIIGDADRETRAIGLQLVREGLPGEAVTLKLADLLPKLVPAAQAELMDALADRADAAARPAVLKMVESSDETVAAAALRALGSLGSSAEVPLLAQKVAGESTLQKAAAQQSLVRLRGDGIDEAIVAAVTGGEPNVRVALLGVLAGRNAKSTMPSILKSTEDSEASVRLAAIGALRYLADESQTAVLVGLVKAAKDEAERRKAELTLLSVCSRGRQACADALIAGMADADAPTRIVLLHALARAGGPQALDALVARLKDDDPAVRLDAVRTLAIWPDRAVAPRLVELAKSSDPREAVLAVRGLVRLAGPGEELPADPKLFAEAMGLAKRPQEKLLVVGSAGGSASPQLLGLLASALDDPALTEAAGLAAVTLVEKLVADKAEGVDQGEIRSVMEKVGKSVKNEQVRQRAQKVVKAS